MNRNIGQLAAIGNAAARRGRLTLTRVEQELGKELLTIDDAMRSLAQIRLYAAAKMLPGSQASAAVQACREWITGHKVKAEIGRLMTLIEQQTTRIQEQEREIARLKRRVG